MLAHCHTVMAYWNTQTVSFNGQFKVVQCQKPNLFSHQVSWGEEPWDFIDTVLSRQIKEVEVSAVLCGCSPANLYVQGNLQKKTSSIESEYTFWSSSAVVTVNSWVPSVSLSWEPIAIMWPVKRQYHPHILHNTIFPALRLAFGNYATSI